MKLFGHVFGSHAAQKQRLVSASWTDCGLVRKDNQDNFFVCDECLSYCVADGMGGCEGGAKASEIVCKVVRDAIGKSSEFIERVRTVDDAVKKANADIRAYSRKAGFKLMGTTVTVMMFDPDDMSEAIIGYVGDTRAYRWSGGSLLRVTRDHTMAEELSRISKTCLDAELAGRASRLSHVLTRAVGVDTDVNMEWRRIDAHPGDWFIVCSAGVYDLVDDGGMSAAFAMAHKPEDVIASLCKQIVANGADDNYTMIVIKMGDCE